MATSNLDRLNTLLTDKVGFSRVRDVRLDKIASDRALEMRYHQGLTYNKFNPILHQPIQLRARVYPWQSIDGVTENALWHYYPPTWVDPIQAAVDFTFPDDPATYGEAAGTAIGWWNSTVHHDQLIDPRWTHWGHGIHWEDTSLGARRWYFITVFATALDPLPLRSVTLQATQHVGYHLTSDGRVIHRLTRNITTPTVVQIDDRAQFPQIGPMVHLASKPLRNRWLKDDERLDWSEL